jgi:hypothetical protein
VKVQVICQLRGDLGHCISSKGIESHPAKLDKISQFRLFNLQKTSSISLDLLNIQQVFDLYPALWITPLFLRISRGKVKIKMGIESLEDLCQYEQTTLPLCSLLPPP